MQIHKRIKFLVLDKVLNALSFLPFNSVEYMGYSIGDDPFLGANPFTIKVVGIKECAYPH